ncbi:MAG TPA: hypothetical protein VFP87_15965 [Chitinophagaceae bacterium]|nr:hypothetical protein [Chitinophagaceae bacterium]
MKENTIVQFVMFETALDREAFIPKWEQYKQAMGNTQKIVLQQRILKNGKFKYISQHNCSSSEFKFVFNKERKVSKTAEAEVKKKLAGGYSTLQLEFVGETKSDESKILIFILDPAADLDGFRQFCVHGKLNIYEAYYQNCEFSYILEFFVKNEYAADVVQQLKILTSFTEAGIYKECHVSHATHGNNPISYFKNHP